MLSYTPNNWFVSSYTNDTWTDLVSEESILATLIICNTTQTEITVEARLVDSNDNHLVTILPATSIESNVSESFISRSINVLDTQKLQVKCSASGANIFASGVI